MGIAKGQGQNDINQQENSAAVLGRQIGETPDISQSYRCTSRRKYKPDLPGEGAPLVITFFHIHLSYCILQNQTAISVSQAP